MSVEEMRAKLMTIFGSHWRKQVARMSKEKVRIEYDRLIKKNLITEKYGVTDESN